MDAKTKTNLTLWQPGLNRKRGHVESYFLRLNDTEQNFALWLKFTLYTPLGARDETVVETWGIFFDGTDSTNSKGWKETRSIADADLARESFHLRFGPSILEQGKTRGEVSGPAGKLAWDLTFTEGEEAVAHFPYQWMYKAKLPKSKLYTPHPSSRFSGTFTIGDKQYKVDNVPGMQGHNWGTEHSYLYSWTHCSAFKDHGDDTWFEGFSSRLKIGPFVTPHLSMAVLSLRGRRYMWNGAQALFRSKIESATDRWSFQIPGDEFSIRGTVQAPKDRFLGLHYYNPNGDVRYCLNSKMADGEIELLDRNNILLATLKAERTFAFEVLVHDPKHGVKMVA
jgi:hypothetical protein